MEGVSLAAKIIILLLSFIILFLVGYICFQNYRERKLMERLHQMLEEAIGGAYSEDTYDESLLSALEVKLARFLSSSKYSFRKAEAERDKIKTLISDISHQTKTPIANIRLYSELLMEAGLPERENNAVDAINEQARKLQFLIEALIHMSRLENGIIAVKPEKRPIEEMTESVYREILPKAEEKGITVLKESTEIYALYDLKWTSEALYNIVDNAVKYTHAGGQIKISVTKFEMFCRIDVEDNGIGISETEHAKLFGRFYRSSNALETEGIGVGLYLAREIVSSQGGYIRVKSKKGEGAVFSMYLSL